MTIYVSNTLRVIEPSDDLLRWAKKELILVNPDYLKKARMGFWMGNTPATIQLYEKRGNVLIIPFGTLKDLPLEVLKEAEIKFDFPVPKTILYAADVPLYDYQSNAVDAMIESGFGILQAPAGSGKTQIGIALATRLSKRALWLCHTKDLVNQSKKRAMQYIDKSLIGTITEGKVDIGEGITFATVQTMCNLDLPQYRDIWDVVIVDECHRVAGSPTTVTRYQKVLNALAARHKYGLSATVHRSDGLIRTTYALLGQVVYRVLDNEVADKIMKVGIKAVNTNIGISRNCLNPDGTLNFAKMINYLAANEERNRLIVNLIEFRPSLILSDRLEHLNQLISMLPKDMQDLSVMISGKSKKADREQALDDMRCGKKMFLFATYSLAKEGLDVPCLERLYMATPQKDYAVVAQSVGRIARRYDGKLEAIAYDFVDNIGWQQRAFKKRCTTYRKIGCYFI